MIETIVSSGFYFIILISILVFVHELGHYLTAIWTGMRAEVFAIGMGTRLFGYNKITGFTFGKLKDDIDLGDHTDWRVCLLPIGGYVKISGMVDESFDTEFAGKPAEPYEFRSKKNWQKALVLSGGVIMNLLLALAVFWYQNAFVGAQHFQTTTIGYVELNSIASHSGFLAGDKIVSVNNIPVSTWQEAVKEILAVTDGRDRIVVLDRAGIGRKTLLLHSEPIVKGLADRNGLGMDPANTRVVLHKVLSLMPAGKAGLEAGDRLLAIDSMPIVSVQQVKDYVKSHTKQNITVHIERGEKTLPKNVYVGADSIIGVEMATAFLGEVQNVKYGFVESISRSFNQVTGTVATIGNAISGMIVGKTSAKNTLGGPVQIAGMAKKAADGGSDVFLGFMALISISLAVMNLLPLPGLDGGHLVFVAIESVIRREIPTSIKMRVQQVGVGLLLIFMVFVLYLDITR